MNAKEKLQEFAEMLAAASRARSQAASPVAEPSQTDPIASEDASIDSDQEKLEPAVAKPAADEAQREQAPTTNQPPSPLAGLDLDTAIRLRWALRDIKAKRTKLTPVSPSDLKTLFEMGLVEMRDDAPMLTNEGHQALDQGSG
jgi:hypothetical protein